MRANLAALTTLRAIQGETRSATLAEQAVLARWSGWGAVPQVFDQHSPRYADYAWAREELGQLLTREELLAASRNTLNAHYTDAAYVQAIWAGMRSLGFDGGRVLEPGCGSGNFLAFAPEGVKLVGVEREPVTAAIAQALYPDAQILSESFADTRIPEGYFDAAVGNVPFGKITLTDPRHNPAGHSIHNHFIIKSLHLVRPGGLVAVLTSRYTMDTRHPAARREIAALADLVGAVRLPTGAHRHAAGTDAVTDLLILRRRAPGQAPDPVAWEQTRILELSGSEALPEPIQVNQYFLDHPEQVLGTFAVGKTTTAMKGLEVKPIPDRPTAPAMAAAIERIAERARAAGLTQTTRPADSQANAHAPQLVALVDRDANLQAGYLRAEPGGTFTQIVDGAAVPFPVPRTQAAELRALLGLRDTVVDLLTAEAATLDDTDELGRLRADLNRRYDSYARQYGPLNRFTWRGTGRTDPTTGQERLARVRPPQGGFRRDPFAPVVLALEHFDAETMHAVKADIFTQRVVAPRAPRLGADTPADALAICLDTHGTADLDEIARLLGVDPPTAREALGTLAFDDPQTARLVPAAEYLSGNVRVKLAQAEAAAGADPRYTVNVQALREVLPADLEPSDIDARLGAAWIDDHYVQAFLRELLDDPGLHVEHPGGSVWAVKGSGYSVLATSTWGTRRMPAPALAQAILEQRQIRVYDRNSDGTVIFNPTETTAAQEKAAELGERFSEWVWEDPVRAKELAGIYNERFNAIVLRSYDDVTLSLPGLAVSFKPRPHQVSAAARIIHEPATLLAHDVGAGKAQPMDARILTPAGYRRMGDLMVGDEVITVEGSVTLIVGVFPQGPRDNYRVTFSDGAVVECNDEHLWQVTTSDWKAKGISSKVLSLAELLDRGLRTSKGNPRWEVPVAAAADFDCGEPRPIDPYLLGVLIGDGNLTSGHVRLSSADKELLDEVGSLLPEGYTLEPANSGRPHDYRITRGLGVTRGGSQLVAWLYDLGLMGMNAHHKHVPRAYLQAPIDARVALLQGLMDTDGTIAASRPGCAATLTTASRRLAHNVAWLARSLGGVANPRPRSVKGSSTTFYVVTVSLPAGITPFRLARKAKHVTSRSKYPIRRTIVSVEPVGRKPMQCIAVAHPSQLYVTSDFVVTHNTAEMAMGTIELRRLGLATKPMIVVPNHMLDQFASEFLQTYPRAKVLVATEEDLASDRRRAFVGRCATGDWDAIVIHRGGFQRIPMSYDAQREYLDQELEALRGWIERSKAKGEGGRSFTVKRLEAALERAEERLKKTLAGVKDAGVTFEQTGVDCLVVDETHDYKNLRTASNIPDAAIDGSQRASDLDMKLDYVRRRHEGRLVFATATPIANSVTEAYVMQRYLRPDLLQAVKIEDFDTWASTFGEVTTDLELGPAGGFRMKSRFAKFRNVPEMLKLWHVSADVKTGDDLKLPTPALVGGAAETVVIDPSLELLTYTAELGERAEDVRARRVEPEDDNMLKIGNDGRLASLDLRLVGRTTTTPQKVDIVAARIAEIWAKHRDDVYPGLDGADDQVRGSLQLVFCDLGTPSDDWNVYDQLRNHLVARGLPRQQVRFIHEARNDQQKAELFAACRAGRVAVLVGSTQKMGVGTNVQRRAIALHHLDCPWRPVDLTQREGRILRQGNLNPEVHVIRYVTERGFDGYLWQTVQRKAAFIGQVMRGRLDVREIEDIGDTALSYNEVKALAAGDPRLLEMAQADATLARLERLDRAWTRNQHLLGRELQQNEQEIEQLTILATQIETALPRRRDTRGDAFVMEVGGARFHKRADAGKRLRALLEREVAALGSAPERRAEVGGLGGFAVTATVLRLRHPAVILRLQDVPESAVRIDQPDLGEVDPTGLVTRLEHRLTALESLQDDTRVKIERLRTEVARARQTIGQPFPQQEQLAQARDHARRLAEELEALANEQADQANEQDDQAAGQPATPEVNEQPAVTHQTHTALAASTARAIPPASPTTISAAPPGGPPVPPSQSPSHPRPVSPPAGPPPALSPPPAASATAAPAPAAQICITHTDNDTVVRGTDREDLAVRKVLKANRFTWSRNQQFWYLPRPWGYARRTSHVRGLLEGLRGLGRPVHVEDGQPLPQRELKQARDHVRQLAEEAQTLANEQEQPAGAPASTPEQRPDDAARTAAAVDDATSVPDDADAATILRERLAPQGLPGGVVEQAGWPSREPEEISVEF